MKQIVTFAILIVVTFTSYSQSLGYQDLGILFSESEHTGTARFTAMSGAFGAIGGDISTINVNPAGLAVYKNSMFSGTFNSRSATITTNYYGTTVNTQNQYFNIPQAGAVLVFNTYNDSDWSKVVVGFNYRIKKDFNTNFLAKGNSGAATFTTFPLDESSTPTEYNIADEQVFNNVYSGELSEINVGISAVHQNKLYIGAALNTYDLRFSQRSTLTEFNSDEDGNELDVNLYQENITTGSGFSINAGFIYKLHSNFRFGLSYQTPTWFTEVLQDTNYDSDSDIDIGETSFFQGDQEYTEYNDWEYIAYKLKTPGKLTASAAILFGKKGLISFDYIKKNYQNINLSDGYFVDENQFFQNNLKNTNSFNMGTEWRVGRMSVRGGYQYEESPYENALETDNIKRYSFGGGYHFGNFKVDFSYSDYTVNSQYNFYSQFNGVNAANLTTNTGIFTTTITLNL